jgi:aspartyl-tRNA(Asn)/glutamyl-tRNA(Gln) amidotransferase subunit A
VEASVRAAIAGLEAAGAAVRPVHLPHTRHALAAYYVIATAEASSNLARFDGVRFGMRRERSAARGGGLAAMYRATRGQGFGEEVRLRILLGTFVLSAGYHDAYYLRAQRVRALIARDFTAAFEDVDVIAAPTSPTVAFPIGERAGDPLAMYRADVLTLPASLAGLPAVSVPCGLSTATAARPALPIGLQLIGRPFEEATVLRAARAHEEVTPGIGWAPDAAGAP